MDTSEHSEGTIRTRLTELFCIKHPILCAPMAFVTGGELAAAVSRAGGLGIVGGSYAGILGGEPDLEAEIARAKPRSESYLRSQTIQTLTGKEFPQRPQQGTECGDFCGDAVSQGCVKFLPGGPACQERARRRAVHVAAETFSARPSFTILERRSRLGYGGAPLSPSILMTLAPTPSLSR
jgi:Nitronate monooxygenase